jgi:hypothetical protein
LQVGGGDQLAQDDPDPGIGLACQRPAQQRYMGGIRRTALQGGGRSEAPVFFRRQQGQARQRRLGRAAQAVVDHDGVRAVGQRQRLTGGRVDRPAVVDDQELAGRGGHQRVVEQRLQYFARIVSADSGDARDGVDAGVGVVAGQGPEQRGVNGGVHQCGQAEGQYGQDARDQELHHLPCQLQNVIPAKAGTHSVFVQCYRCSCV